MNNKKAFALLMAAMLVGLSGCDSGSGTVTPEATADYSVNIQMPFARVTEEPREESNNPDVSIDANGNVTLHNSMEVLSGKQDIATLTQDTGYVTLQIGSNGTAVREMQTRLKDLGYFTGSVTGIFDNDTEAAVRRFEKSYGVMQTGIATEAFQTKLYAPDAPAYGSEEYEAEVTSHYNTLQTGSVGSDVYALQYRLRELGYPITELTAIFDQQTEYCVRLFCRNAGKSDSLGVAYISVQRAIYSEDAPRYTGGGQTADDESDTLVMGDSGAVVTRIQNRLIELGYMEGTASGVYDAATVTAVQQFQRVCGFTVTGSVPYYLRTMLLSDGAEEYAVTNMSVVLTEGDQGSLVGKLQERLIELGYANGTASGNYDANTAAALRLFQQYNGLEITGVATEGVQAALYADTAISYKQALRILAGDTVVLPTPAPTEMGQTPIPTAVPTPEPTPETTATPRPVVEEGGKPLPTLYVENPLTEIVEGDPNNTLAPDATEIPDEVLETFAPDETEAPVEQETVYYAGMKGSEVKKIQARLKELGYSVKRTGKFDDQTVEAVKQFQSSVGVTQSGEVNETLYAYLFSDAAPSTGYVMYRSVQDYYTLKAGDRGESVIRLQRQLGRLGYMLNTDIEKSGGVYDDATVAAVISAQRAMGYEEPDGIAGAEFQCFVFSEFSGRIKR